MPGSRPRLFISYKHEQSAIDVVHELDGLLRDDYEVLVDTNLRVGDEWNPTLERWLRACDAAIILISPGFLKSDYCSYEVGVLMHRERGATAGVERASRQFKVFPYRLAGVSSEMLEQAKGLRPARLSALQAPELPASDTVVADLGVIPRDDPRTRHRDRLKPLLPSGDALDGIAAEVFADLYEVGTLAKDVVTDGLLERVSTVDAHADRFLKAIAMPLDRLAPYLDRDTFRNLAFVVGAGRVAYADAATLDGVSGEAHSFFVTSVPTGTADLIRLVLACAGATRWTVALSVLEKRIASVIVDAPPTAGSPSIIEQVRTQAAACFCVTSELLAKHIEDNYGYSEIPVNIIVSTKTGQRLKPAVVEALREEFPWTNVIVITDRFPNHERWVAKSKATALIESETHLDEEFCASFSDMLRFYLRDTKSQLAPTG